MGEQAQAAQQLQFAWKMRHHRTDSRANFKMALLTARVQKLWRAKKRVAVARHERGARLVAERAGAPLAGAVERCVELIGGMEAAGLARRRVHPVGPLEGIAHLRPSRRLGIRLGLG